MTYTVLVVDADADARELVRQALARSDDLRVVAEAGSGEQAVEIAARLQPDLALVEVALPGRDGLWVLSGIRDASPGTKTIVRSPFSREELEFVVARTGSAGYVDSGGSVLELPAQLGSLVRLLGTVGRAIAAAREVFATEAASPARARRFVGRSLPTWAAESSAQIIELLVSELVTNAVVHAHSDAEVSVEILGDRARVDVFDQGEGSPSAPSPDPEQESGRGIMLLTSLSTNWGVVSRPGGKSVWFEVPLKDPQDL